MSEFKTYTVLFKDYNGKKVKREFSELKAARQEIRDIIDNEKVCYGITLSEDEFKIRVNIWETINE